MRARFVQEQGVKEGDMEKRLEKVYELLERFAVNQRSYLAMVEALSSSGHDGALESLHSDALAQHKALRLEFTEAIKEQRSRLVQNAFCSTDFTAEIVIAPFWLGRRNIKKRLEQAQNAGEVKMVHAIADQAYATGDWELFNLAAENDLDLAALLDFEETFGTLQSEAAKAWLDSVLAAPELIYAVA